MDRKAKQTSPGPVADFCHLLMSKMVWGLVLLQDMWSKAGFTEAFEGPVDVANRVAELLMLKMGVSA